MSDDQRRRIRHRDPAVSAPKLTDRDRAQLDELHAQREQAIGDRRPRWPWNRQGHRRG